MTSRERILSALSHQVPDHTPTDGWFHPEVIQSLKSHFGTDDWPEVLERLGVDRWAEIGPYLVPRDSDHDAPQTGHASGAAVRWLDDRTYEDVWGARFRLGEDGRYREWRDGPLANAESADDVATAGLLSIDEIRQRDDFANEVVSLKAAESFTYANLENPFRRLWNLRGYENALIDYVANYEVLDAVFDIIYPIYTEMALRAARAGVDMIRIVGDIAMQDRIIMGPDAWRRHDKPRLAKLIASVRAERPDIHIFFHSDGKLTDLMDDLIEVGFDVINPIQPECMEPSDVKRRWGDKITLHGCISIQETLPFGTTEDVQREVTQLVRDCGYNGGLVLMPSNNIQPDTPIENIIACYEAARTCKP